VSLPIAQLQKHLTSDSGSGARVCSEALCASAVLLPWKRSGKKPVHVLGRAVRDPDFLFFPQGQGLCSAPRGRVTDGGLWVSISIHFGSVMSGVFSVFFVLRAPLVLVHIPGCI